MAIAALAILSTPCTVGFSSTSDAPAASLTIKDNDNSTAGRTQTPDQSAKVSGPAVSLSPSSLSFDSPTIGVASSPQTISLTNTGTASLSITSITVTGKNSVDFSVSNTCGSKVAAGGKCSISVTFTLPAAGTYTAAVSISDNASGSPQTVSLTGAFSSAPTTYTSRTDLLTVQVPNPPPNVGALTGANIVITDPDFNNQIVRVTDANTDPSLPNQYYMTTQGSAELDIWNMDSTLFFIRSEGGYAYPFAFDPTTLQASRLYVSDFPDTNGFVTVGQPVWSHTNASLAYLPDASASPIIDSLDFSDQTTPPSPQTVYNFATSPNCLPALAGAVTYSIQGGSNGTDTTFAMAYSTTGGQDTPAYAVVYRVGSGCNWYNTSTGSVGGNWGSAGTVTTSDRYTIHNIKISKDGNWAVITGGSCLSGSNCSGLYFWKLGTTSTSICPTGHDCTGHRTNGYTHWANSSGTPNSGSETTRQFNNATAFTQLTNDYPADIGIFENHQSWSNANSTDTTPVFDGTASTVSPFPSAWYNEILGYATNGSGTVWRFAHSFITGESQVFSAQYGIGSVSQDGRFYIVSSDWMGTLGSVSGAETCTISVDCRSDCFVVQLK